MGVNSKFYVVRGFYCNAENLSDEEMDYIVDNDSVIMVSPMESCDFIVGDILVESNDGRYEPLDFKPFTFESLDCRSSNEIFKSIPKFLRDKLSFPRFGTYCFICYS